MSHNTAYAAPYFRCSAQIARLQPATSHMLEPLSTMRAEQIVFISPRNNSILRGTGAMKIKEVLSEFRTELEKLYGDRLKNIILYGSWAKGDATKKSDIDLLIVLGEEIIPGKEIDKMIEIITEINLKHNVLISVYPVSERDYSTVNSPLLINVRREGVPA
jgi:predicted nucleotidyltransferase